VSRFQQADAVVVAQGLDVQMGSVLAASQHGDADGTAVDDPA